MLKVVLEREKVNNYLEQSEYSSLATYLKSIFKIEFDEFGAPLQYEFSEVAVKILISLVEEVLATGWSDATENLTKELFRSLRNYVVNYQVQNYLLRDANFLHDVKNIIILLYNVHATDTLQKVLQFLINFVVVNGACSQIIGDIFFSLIFEILKREMAVYEATALLYNLAIFSPEDLSFDIDEYEFLFEIYEAHKDAEFMRFLLESFLNSDHFWASYTLFSVANRIITLEVIRQIQVDNTGLKLCLRGVKALSDQFGTSGEVIFQTASKLDLNLEPYEVSQLLEVLSGLSCDDEYLPLLQVDKNLLINSSVFLINMHKLGKESDNYFSSIQKLSEIRDPSDDVLQHPAFGFKAGLVRLIGNLCWKNKIMQDLVREAELIPVLLDCCNMDARNPLIMQWVILAMRNLCEHNPKNQSIIAGMHQQGAVSSSTLEEMGLSLHSDGNDSLKIVPLEALQNLNLSE